MDLDLTSLGSVQEFAKSVIARPEPLQVTKYVSFAIHVLRCWSTTLAWWQAPVLKSLQTISLQMGLRLSHRFENLNSLFHPTRALYATMRHFLLFHSVQRQSVTTVTLGHYYINENQGSSQSWCNSVQLSTSCPSIPMSLDVLVCIQLLII